MFKSYFVSALRSIKRQRLYSFINIGGLAVALTACLMILLWVLNQMSYDKWVPDAERIERIEMTMSFPSRPPVLLSKVAPALGPALPGYFEADIEYSTRALQHESVVKFEENQFKETVTFVDADFFNVFDFPMASGTKSALSESVSSVYLDETMARKYFGDSEPVGQVLSLTVRGELFDYKVAGVFKDIPKNSHMPFQIITLLDPNRFDGINEVWGSAWMDATYIKFYENGSKESVLSQLGDFMVTLSPYDASDLLHADGSMIHPLNFINIRDIHLYSDKSGHMKPTGSITTVISFSVAAILILLIASINSMNLSTALALRRAKEVSLRKVMGASRQQLIKQFLGESIITAWIALVISIAMLELAVPLYSSYIGTALTTATLMTPEITLGIFVIATLVGILGGVYPAFFLSSYRPSRVLGSSASKNKSSPFVRQLLLIFQFAISITLIIATTIVYLQTSMMQNIDRGFNSAHRLALNGFESPQVSPSSETLRQAVLNIPEVTSAGFSSQDIPMTYHNNYRFYVPSIDAEQSIDTDRVFVDQHFFETYDIEPLAGRVFTEEYTSDFLVIPEEEGAPLTRSVVVTRQFVEKAGFASLEAAIGEYVSLPNMGANGEPIHATIVGVVNDMELRNMREGTTQTAFFVARDNSMGRFNVLTLEIQTGDVSATLSAIDGVWTDIVPDVPISRYFVDDSFEALYFAEEKQATIFAVFSIFAVLVACLGLFGLAVFAAEQRTNEIGIRKVLGAQIFDILKLINWQFIKPVLLANLLAWPVAYMLMRDWLASFAVRIDISLFLFVNAGLLTLLVAATTVTTQAYRVARTNPIHSLRYE